MSRTNLKKVTKTAIPKPGANMLHDGTLAPVTKSMFFYENKAFYAWRDEKKITAHGVQ